MKMQESSLTYKIAIIWKTENLQITTISDGYGYSSPGHAYLW